MKKSLTTLAALAAVGIMATTTTMQEAVQHIKQPPPRRRSTSQRGTSPWRRKISSAHTYPEQSNRQGMRGLRRAQGGPGIVLVDGYYEERRTAA